VNARLLNTRLVATLALALPLAACTVGPDYERPAIDLPTAYPGNADSGQDKVRRDWWTLYGDPTLNELIASALERNADLRMAVARIEEADANLREANAAFLPQIDLSGAANRSRASTTMSTPIPPGVPVIRNDLRLSLTTSFELDFWGRIRRANEAIRAQTLGTRYGRDVVALSLAGLTTQAYFSLRSLDAQVAVTRETLASREESLGFVRARAAGGLTSDLEVGQAEVLRADASAQLKELQRQRALAERQLAVLAGKLDLDLAAGDLRKLPTPAVPPAGLPSTLLERRPDIRQAEQNLISANAQIGVAKAAMLPTLSLTGALGVQSKALSTLLDTGSNIWSLGFGLGLPLFDAGRYAARTDAAIARQHQAVAGYQKSIETAFREVSDSLVTLRQTSLAEEDVTLRLEAARRNLRLARLRYESGYSAFLEVLDAQRTANDAELTFLRNRQAVLSATVDVMRALGGGWSADPAAVSQQ
jgi:multidrug efflux system outer membrane protein